MARCGVTIGRRVWRAGGPVGGLALGGVLALAGCTGTAFTPERTPGASASNSATGTTTPRVISTTAPTASSPIASPPSSQSSTSVTTGATPAPAWLSTRVLPRRPDGFGEVRRTPRELDERRIITRDLLPPPADGGFHATITRVPDEVLARSTWQSACPVRRADLRYVTVSFHGFDGLTHTGELLVHREAAAGIARVFGRLFRAGFPIEEMRVTSAPELDLPPTGDGNNTSAFVCRPTTGSTTWSQHAFGRAIDVNPFHNPYLKGGLVLPELASAYTARDDVRPGMITRRGPVVTAFRAIGWGWGGTFDSLKDWMHFSANGR